VKTLNPISSGTFSRPPISTARPSSVRIWAELEASGEMIGYYDLIVGATALERGSDVATFNKRPFSQIRGLNLVEPK